MQRDVRNWCRTCEACQTRKSAPKRNHAPLQTIKTGYPMQVVAVDIMGPLPESKAGNRYVLVAGDYFTKWAEVYAIPNQEATTVAQKLTDEMFCRFSPPEQLHSDQGRQFESQVIHEICKLLKILKTRTTPYHPQCDGQVERFNRTLLDMLATTTREHAFDWENQIRKVCMAYNTSVHSSTGFTPFFLMFGRQAKLPIDLMYGSPRNVTDTPPISDYAVHLKNSLEDAYSLAREKLGASHERRKEQYDRRVHGNPFQPADLVWLHSTVIPQGHSRKLHHPWTGPYTVVERVSDSDYRIKGLRGRRKTHIVHSSYVHLEPASLQLWTKILLQKTPKHLLPLISLPQMCLAKTCSLSLPRLNSHSRPLHAATPNGIADHRSDLTLPFPIDPEFGANSMRRGTM